MNKKINFHFILVLLAAALWGTAGLFVRSIEKYEFSQMQMVFGRAIVSALLLAVIILIKDRALFKIKLRDLWLFISAGLFSIVLFNFSYYTTMSLTSLSVAAVLLYTAPFFVVIISLFLFNEKLTSNKCIALITAFIGCCLVSGLLDAKHRVSGKALFFGLLTGLGYALYTIFGELLLRKGYKTLTITFYVFASAAICSMAFINPISTVSYAIATPKASFIVFLMALFNTVIPYVLYTTGLAGVSPSAAPIIATVEPVVATVIGAFIFKEDISGFGIVGIALVLLSVVILNLKPLTIKANAKINLILSVVGKREDGYHLIDTVMQSVSLADRIKILPAKKISVKCSNKALGGEENIAFKAAKLFFEETGLNGGAKIIIKKSIPAAAGLGGGSADAAAVLLGLDKLYNTALKSELLEKMALRLGADVPFFIKGATQRAEGIGEVLTPLKNLEGCWFVLVKEDEKPSTAEMYKKLDSASHSLPDTEAAVKNIEDNDLQALSKIIDNSFIAAWEKKDIKEKLLSLGADGVSLSGSGPTWFAMFCDYKKASKAFKLLKKEKINCYFAKAENFGIKFE